jgi:hypothetical protein
MWGNSMMSHDEQRLLLAIERSLRQEDPGLARRLSRLSSGRSQRSWKITLAVALLGALLLPLGFAVASALTVVVGCVLLACGFCAAHRARRGSL